MSHAAVLSKKYIIKFDGPYPGKAIADELAGALGNLAGLLSYKGKIMGHLKAIAVAGEKYLQMSVTSPPEVNIKISPGWYEKEYDNLELTVNIIILGFTKLQLEKYLQESMAGILERSIASA